MVRGKPENLEASTERQERLTTLSSSFEVVGISLDQDRDKLEQFLEKEQNPWTTLHDGAWNDNAVATYYGVMGIPKPSALRQLIEQSGRRELLGDQLEAIHADFVARMIRFYQSDPTVFEIPGASVAFRRLRAANVKVNRPNLVVGEGAVIERAILDKECRIGRNVKIINKRGVLDDEGENYVIRDGIVTIPRGTIVPDGTVI